jgi:molybdenum cofactor cytidylyltransferase
VKFGTVSLDAAEGAILAHGVAHANGVIKKGQVLSAADIAALRVAGHKQVTAALLEAGDVPEDIAAHRIALAVTGVNANAQQPFTGRANIHSAVRGIVRVDDTRLRAVNHLDECLTIATLDDYAAVEPRQMLATVKVIPFAVRREVLEKALAIIGEKPLVSVTELKPHTAGLIITRLSQTKASIIAKSETSIRARLAALGSTLGEVVVCEHQQEDVTRAIAALRGKGLSPILIFGASAIVDRGDVIPAALESASGEVVHLGMPVDPGNLMMLGRLGSTPVIGVPSCARSPKVNGFDWVLERVLAGIEVSRSDIMDMGAGGLLAEIPSRPSPREPGSKLPSAPRVSAIVLAAGTSTRMGSNKMLADFRGQPMVRATVSAIAASSVDQIVVVTGHQHEMVRAAVRGLRARAVLNPHFASGLATSLRCGIEAVAEDCDAALICLGDMPLVEAGVIDRLIAAFNATEHRTIVVPKQHGQLGNPVLWGAEHFVRLMALEGDRGARSLIETLKQDAVEIEAGSDAVLRDADTREALEEMAR